MCTYLIRTQHPYNEKPAPCRGRLFITSYRFILFHTYYLKKLSSPNSYSCTACKPRMISEIDYSQARQRATALT